jgi:hypothetical protein
VPEKNSAFRKTFRGNVEAKLHLASANNSGVILSWELSESFDRADLVCGEAAFNPRVIEHLATSLTRLIGVGKRLEVVDREVRSLTVECRPSTGGEALFERTYEVP